jgi:hypothetical protein
MKQSSAVKKKIEDSLSQYKKIREEYKKQEEIVKKIERLLED